jgi:endoglucanase
VPVSLRNRATGLYLDGMGRTANGADAAQWGGSSSTNQQWRIS